MLGHTSSCINLSARAFMHSSLAYALGVEGQVQALHTLKEFGMTVHLCQSRDVLLNVACISPHLRDFMQGEGDLGWMGGFT